MPRKKASTESKFVWDAGHANPKQALFYSSRVRYTAYGGARGGGKTHAVRIKAVGGAFTNPGIKILIMRRTYKELLSNHIEPILKMVPQELASYNGSIYTLYFENGSIIRFGHWNGITSETEYQGQEYDWLFIDEATQFTEREFRYLDGIVRGATLIPKRLYLTCNPGGVGHRWVKRLFIDRNFKMESDNPEENEDPEEYAFIPATVEDNTDLVTVDPAYVKRLAQLPEDIRRAHRYGDWDALGGNYFPEFSRATHVIEPFQIPANWRRYRSFDYGLDCLAVGWYAVDEKGRSYMYRELKQSGLIVQEAAKAILDSTLPNERIEITFAPPDMWSRQKDTGKTMAEIFMLCGVPIVRADNNRVQGHMQVKEALAQMDDKKPGLLFFKGCKETIADIEDIQADERNPNDCAKEPHSITHTVDGVRYFCVSRTMRAEAERAAVEIEDDEDETEEDYETFMTGGEASAGYMAYGAAG